MTEADPSSITCWIVALKEGQTDAAQELWEAYYARLVALARRRLGDAGRRAFDEEDVALSAFHSVCARAADNAFPRLNDRHDLWSLLVTITARKVAEQKRFLMRQRRGGGKVRGESAFVRPGAADSGGGGLAEIVGREPTPEFAAQVAEEMESLLTRLADPTLRRIAEAKLEGWSNPEIAARLEMSDRTVRRKLKVIAAVLESSP